MAKSKLVETNEKIAKKVVDTYQKIEDTVVGGYTKIEDAFVDRYLTKEGESVEEAVKINGALRRRLRPRPPLLAGNQGATAKSAAAP